jgi:hypothetical protein
VVAPIPRVETPIPRVTANTEAHRTQAVTATQHKDRGNLPIVTNPPVPRQIVQSPATQSKSQSCMSLPNYISQDEDNNQAPMRQTTRLADTSIMQEAMLSCVDIYKPLYIASVDLRILNFTKIPKLTGTTYTVTPKQMAQCKLPMKWLCKMANSVMGVNGELLEYCHLIANQTQEPLGSTHMERDRMPCSGNAGVQHRHQHHRLHQEKPGTTEQSRGRDLQPNRLPHQT